MGNNVGAGSLDGTQGSKPRADQQAGPKFDELYGAHDLECASGATTVVLAAIAAVNGLKFTGEEMRDRRGRPATIAGIATEAGLHVETVRQAVRDLQGAGHVERRDDGVHANPEALAARRCDGSRAPF